MSVQPRDWSVIPSNRVEVARAAFPKGNVYMKMRDELGVLYSAQDFVNLFRSDCGQNALSPGQLALVIVMQFGEGLSDRQAPCFDSQTARTSSCSKRRNTREFSDIIGDKSNS